MSPEAQAQYTNSIGGASTLPHGALRGLTVQRRFTKEGQSPFDTTEYELRSSIIRKADGRVVFNMESVEVPKAWSQVATDILAQKYFRKAGVPQKNADGTAKLNADGTPVLGSETSVKQVVHRLAGCWRAWGEKYGYFATEKDAEAYYDEMAYMLLHQMAAPNSPQWFNTGLFWAYGINGPAQGHYYVDPDSKELTKSSDAYSHPQPHACFIQSVNDDLVNEGGIMDLWVREARLFKYGSGTGTNFSSIRGNSESLSGGGASSGLMSWLKIGDRAAGAIKSGGTTRRAAKMVIVDADHPDIEEFVMWKANEEKKVAALVAAGYASDYEGEAYNTVSGQNSNNSIRVTNAFMDAVTEDRDWNLRWRTDGSVCKTLKARDLWNKVADAAWKCADPGVQLDTTINEWHTAPKSGRINASNPCSEYMFLDNTACNLASINLAHFFDSKTMVFDVDSFRHASRLWTITLEVSVLMAQFPSKEIAQMSYEFRTLGLGYANLGAGVLLAAGIPYDSKEARAIGGAITAIMTGESYATSAEMAKNLGAFNRFELNRSDMLRVIRNHRRAAYNAPADEYEKLAIKPVGIDPNACPVYLLRAARGAWDRALELGEIYGYRNAQTTLLAPTGTIGLLMDCATTGVEPDFALVKFKKLAGGGYFKIVNESIPVGLKTLGYTDDKISDIVEYMRGVGTLSGAPHINHGILKTKGFTDEDIAKIEKQLPGVFELQFAFNVYALGEDLMKRLGFKPEQYNDFNFNMLAALGFTDEQVAETNDFVCGTMTIEGAPHLKKEHYPVFDCANRCGKKGERFIHHMGHIRMMAAVQPFLSGAISKTINMPNEVTIEDIKEAYMESWKLGIKAMALYRDGCKLSQPLAGKSDTKATTTEKEQEPVAVPAASANADLAAGDIQSVQASSPVSVPSVSQNELGVVSSVVVAAAVSNGLEFGKKRALPAKRTGITVEAKIGNQQVYLRTGEYPNGELGEIFIDMYREGAAFRSVLNCLAISISMGLQYGVPLEKFVEKFTFTRFEPSGFTTHPNVKMCTSIVDYIFRVLAVEYLGRFDLAQVPPEGIEKNRTEKLQEIAEAAVKITEQILPEDVLRATQVGEQTAMLAMENSHSDAGASAAAHGHGMKSAQGLDNLMGDAPPCDTCGHTTVRNGSCYRCLNCGASMGCS
ncbi:MAG: vitamin B12-dependent ribonucleotide reductase [Candidatus Magasanikbacteria bacterium]|nr:vitamin B12-dependent ribonucleotide reductase [Candidatus Magasanikbacteria bacterium]